MCTGHLSTLAKQRSAATIRSRAGLPDEEGNKAELIIAKPGICH